MSPLFRVWLALVIILLGLAALSGPLDVCSTDSECEGIE